MSESKTLEQVEAERRAKMSERDRHRDAVRRSHENHWQAMRDAAAANEAEAKRRG